MTEEKVEKFRQPGLIFSVIEEHHPVNESNQSFLPSWCVCGRCWEMAEFIEQVCCEKILEDCISLLPDCFIPLNF